MPEALRRFLASLTLAYAPSPSDGVPDPRAADLAFALAVETWTVEVERDARRAGFPANVHTGLALGGGPASAYPFTGLRSPCYRCRQWATSDVVAHAIRLDADGRAPEYGAITAGLAFVLVRGDQESKDRGWRAAVGIWGTGVLPGEPKVKVYWEE
jgi:hypothetical protein